MKELVIARDAVNLEALDADLRAALGGATSGLSFRAGQVTVHLADTATDAQINQARAIAQAHDPSKPTPAQQAAASRRARLAQLRGDYGADLDLTNFNGQGVLIRLLAGKIAWLEQEIASLRAGETG
jgi:hypothetical protein